MGGVWAATPSFRWGCRYLLTRPIGACVSVCTCTHNMNHRGDRRITQFRRERERPHHAAGKNVEKSRQLRPRPVVSQNSLTALNVIISGKEDDFLTRQQSHRPPNENTAALARLTESTFFFHFCRCNSRKARCVIGNLSEKENRGTSNEITTGRIGSWTVEIRSSFAPAVVMFHELMNIPVELKGGGDRTIVFTEECGGVVQWFTSCFSFCVGRPLLFPLFFPFSSFTLWAVGGVGNRVSFATDCAVPLLQVPSTSA